MLGLWTEKSSSFISPQTTDYLKLFDFCT